MATLLLTKVALQYTDLIVENILERCSDHKKIDYDARATECDGARIWDALYIVSTVCGGSTGNEKLLWFFVVNRQVAEYTFQLLGMIL